MTDKPEDSEQIKAQVEIWKKIVDVQQHFNDLELRIRNFALIVTGAFIGLGGYAIKDGASSTPSFIVAAAIIPLIAFYLMDRLWYHRLLDGAVQAGISAETKLKELGLDVDLGSQISKASPFFLFGTKIRVHSRHKMDGFYGLLVAAIAALSAAIAFGVKPAQLSGAPQLSESERRATELADDAAAKAVCEAHVAELYARANGVAGSIAVDPKTGQQAVLVAGRWRLVPKC